MLQLPYDYQRPATPSYRGARLRFVIPTQLAEELERLSASEEATLFMALQAAFAALLGRHAGADDILIGTPIAGRVRLELEPLIGCFVNSLVLRSDLRGAPTFRALLRRARGVALDAYAHQEVPFDIIVDALQPRRARGHNPIFQVMFALHNVPPARVALAGLHIEPLPVDTGTAKFDLSLDLERGSAGLAAVFEYSTDLFSRITIAHLAEQYLRLLRAVAAAPDESIARLAPASETERAHLDTLRRAAPVLAETTAERRRVAPRTPTEVRLACMCAELLELDSISVTDDFFELGGTSLVGTRLITRVRTVFRVEVALRDLFDAPTVADFAAVIDAAPPLTVDDVLGYFEEERL